VLAWDSREKARALLPPGVETGDPLGRILDGYAGVGRVRRAFRSSPSDFRPCAQGQCAAVLGDIELFAQARGARCRRIVSSASPDQRQVDDDRADPSHSCDRRPAGNARGNIGLPILARCRWRQVASMCSSCRAIRSI